MAGETGNGRPCRTRIHYSLQLVIGIVGLVVHGEGRSSGDLVPQRDHLIGSSC